MPEESFELRRGPSNRKSSYREPTVIKQKVLFLQKKVLQLNRKPYFFYCFVAG